MKFHNEEFSENHYKKINFKYTFWTSGLALIVMDLKATFVVSKYNWKSKRISIKLERPYNFFN